ncbi:putative transcriptional regulator [Azorhizobium caulinodans ORS 571]|uniref:Putative transcriptional regulator n=1 Tax=Azorhizobium caulinodans (strain ATCC 43989 / DSM 5975 / JCM 20966 / LMG 6465 / NBRC 14845 / NCIMB 13405 / ORS 571) TaxID=438753 RepID=A8INT7_AZOC5|nr:Crp/Fnr family transcriptional regulator [Azorhizobium caulinodans]BAF89786.1 putative transcriptional regulator [Azorhizobium caulinodans ORS 571]
MDPAPLPLKAPLPPPAGRSVQAARMPAKAEVPPVVARSCLFQGLTGDEVARIFARAHPRSFTRDEPVITDGDLPERLYFVTEGSFICRKTSPAGLVFTLGQLHPGSFFGESGVIGGRRSDMDVTATGEAAALGVPASDFRHALERHPSISRHLVDEMAARIAALTLLSFEVATLKLDARLSRAIAKLARERDQFRDGGLIRPAPTHAELAAMLGTTREVVSRSMTALSRQGLIETRRQEILIRRALGLQNFER